MLHHSLSGFGKAIDASELVTTERMYVFNWQLVAPEEPANLHWCHRACFGISGKPSLRVSLEVQPPFFIVGVYHHPKGATIFKMVVQFQGYDVWKKKHRQCFGSYWPKDCCITETIFLWLGTATVQKKNVFSNNGWGDGFLNWCKKHANEEHPHFFVTDLILVSSLRIIGPSNGSVSSK